MGKASTPPQPDYAAAAKETAQGNLEAARMAAQANRVNYNTPYGSLKYSQTQPGTFNQSAYDAAMKSYQQGTQTPGHYEMQGGTPGPNGSDGTQIWVPGGYTANTGPAPKREDFITGANPDAWQADVTLDPSQKALLDAQNQTSIGLANLQGGALDRVGQTQAKPFDYSSIQDVQDQAYKGYTSRLDPQWQQAEAAYKTQLRNQGIPVGSEAYDNAMRVFTQGKNDAYQQANTAAINTMPQTFQLASALRSQPLNELNALRTGAQVTNPTFNAVPQQATTAGPDMLGAANMQYNAALGASNAENAASGNFMSGLFGLGGAVLGAPAGSIGSKFFSDRRLKRNIQPLGKWRGHDWYIYEKFGRVEVGVMAQEVARINPAAVSVHPSGYLMVDYGAL